MASLGHIAVGMVAARTRRRPGDSRARGLGSVALWTGLSLLPDADVVGFRYGIAYANDWGHRGATHSLAFALVVGAVCAIVARLAGLKHPQGVGVLAAAVSLSHPLLDMLTDGGLGCALWWPFSSTRYFAPWSPIPVAPIGLRLFSAAGLSVLATEAVLFLPLFALALWPARASRSSDAGRA